MAAASGVATAVCSDPKVFVGQLPLEAQQTDVERIFSAYGPLKSCVLIPGTKRCAMVLYEKWSHAEAAVETEQGKSSLGGSKPLVVKFADPPKRASAGPGASVGIAPKKLFVGQIPVDVTDDDLNALFSPYGQVVEVHRHNKPGQPIGCCFVSFSRWSEAEAAMEALNGQHQFPAATAKLVVKFADAKPGAAARPGEKRPPGGDMAQGPNKKAFSGGGGPMGMGNPYGGQLAGLGFGALAINPLLAMGMPNFGALNLNNMGLANMQALRMMNPAAAAALSNAAAAAAMAQQGGKGTGVPWKLFIGQIPYEMSEQDLMSLFGSIGGVAEVAVLRGPDGRSKGCAFVSYMNGMQAEQAVQQFNGRTIPGDPRAKPIVVKYANLR